jgi:hypothetical protein
MDDTEKFELLVMRLVDGELSPQEEDDLLVSCELEPDRYREVALAFWEDRRLAAGLAKATRGEDIPAVAALPSGGLKRTEKATAGSAPRWPLWLTGLAASLLIGAFIGYTSAPSAGIGGGAEPPRVAEPTTPEPPGPERAFAQRNRASGPPVRNISEHPQQLRELVRQLEPEPVFPQDTLAELARDGVRVNQSTELFLIELPGNRHLALPAQFIDLSGTDR